MLLRSFLTLFAFLFIVFSSHAQDTAQATRHITYFLTDKSFDQGTYSQVDTSLDNYHYYPPGFYQNLMTLGFTGSPAKPMFYSKPYITGFNSGIDFLDVYTSKKDQILYYNTLKPYSKVFFLMGSKDEQILNVKHSQNVGKTFNFGLHFTNISSTGFYLRQKNRINDFHAHTSYLTKNRFYGSFANFAYSNISFEENGGLLSDLYFEEFMVDRKDAIPITLQNASNRYRKKSWYLKQFLNIGKREEIFDKRDSVNRKVVSPLLRLAHTFSFEKQIASYRDAAPDSIFYLPLFNYRRFESPMDTILDSINIKIYENSISLSTVDFTDFTGQHQGFKNFYASAFIKHQNIERLTHNDNYDTSFQNIIAGAEFNFHFLKFFRAGGNASQVLEGFNRGDHTYQGFAEFIPLFKKDSLREKKEHSLRLETYHKIKQPDWIFTHYYSDQLQWQNDFIPISYSGQSLTYLNEKWKLEAGLGQHFVKNQVYIAEEDIFISDTVFAGRLIRPAQRPGRLTINQAYIKKQFTLWKFHLNSSIYFQDNNYALILAYPDLITYNSFYFESLMLRKSIYGQIGIDLFYYSKYYANAYSPLLKQFYAQDEKAVGDYPFLDFFVNIRIKSVRAFFKITHLNSGFFGNTYYMIPHYPQADRAFRLGIDWRFLD